MLHLLDIPRLAVLLTHHIIKYSRLAQWLERLAQNRKILGSNPSHTEHPVIMSSSHNS